MNKNSEYLIPGKFLESQEEDKSVEIEVINEKDPNNLLSDQSRNLVLLSHSHPSPYSGEGFAENPKRQAELAFFLIEKLDLKSRGASLDVGFGSNIHISNTFADEGIKSYALDELVSNQTTNESMWHAPKQVRLNERNVEILSGDIVDIGKNESEIKDKQFGLILFNGSWSSGGNNWTVAGEVMEGKYYNKPDRISTLVEFMDQEKDAILESCKKRLTSNGLIGVVSSRYAFHGAGYDFSQLPEEKLSFIDVYDRFQRLGAKKIHLFGISQDGFDQILTRSMEQSSEGHNTYEVDQNQVALIREQLRLISNIPENDVYSRFGNNQDYQKSRLHDVIEATKNIPELNAIARIDAIFAEF